MAKIKQNEILNLKDTVDNDEYNRLIVLAHKFKYKRKMLFSFDWIERRCMDSWQDKQVNDWQSFYYNLHLICDNNKWYKMLKL